MGTESWPPDMCRALGGFVHHLVQGQQGEVVGHPLHDGFQAHHGGAHAQAGEAQFGDGRVQDPFGAVFFQEPAGDLVGAIVFGDFLAHEDDHVVPGHLFVHGPVEGVSIADLRHR